MRPSLRSAAGLTCRPTGSTPAPSFTTCLLQHLRPVAGLPCRPAGSTPAPYLPYLGSSAPPSSTWPSYATYHLVTYARAHAQSHSASPLEPPLLDPCAPLPTPRSPLALPSPSADPDAAPARATTAPAPDGFAVDPRLAIEGAAGSGARRGKRKRAAQPLSHEQNVTSAFSIITSAWQKSTESSSKTALRRLLDYINEHNLPEPFRMTLGDPAASLHNELTLLAWAASMYNDGLAAGTISSYVSLAKTALSVRLGWTLTSEATQTRLPRFLKGLRRLSPHGARKRRLGWRSRHMRLLRELFGLPTGVEATSADALLNLSRQALLRGADFLPEQKGQFRPHLFPTVGDWDECEASRNDGVAGKRIYAQALCRPAKKGAGKAKTELLHFPLGDGITDAFSSIRRHLQARVAANGGKPLSPDAPLVAHTDGSSYTVKEMRTLVRNSAVAIGLNAADFGAHSSRIGGATDLFASGCPPAVIQILGRW